MWYLFLQMYGWIFLAFVLGWVCHWLICCRGKEEHSPSEKNANEIIDVDNNDEVLTVTEATATAVDDSWKPEGFHTRPDNTDELKRIKGIGAVIEETLNQLGIYQFGQIANWTEDNIAWVEKFLAFPGRIGREGWVSQAQTLSDGGTTEFSNRVDKGDVDYS